MPVHVKREPDTLLVVFERDGEEPATRHALKRRRAGVRLLIDYRALRVGDRLTARRRRTIKQSRCIVGWRRHHLKGPTMKLFTGICLMIILASCAGPGPYGPARYGPAPYGPEPYGPGPYASAVQPAMSGPQLPVSYQRKCYDCMPWRQDANPK